MNKFLNQSKQVWTVANQLQINASKFNFTPIKKWGKPVALNRYKYLDKQKQEQNQEQNQVQEQLIIIGYKSNSPII